MKIKVDLHIHSTYSGDSTLTVDEIVSYYALNGYHAIAITDHDSFRGAIEARKIVREMNLNLIVILGAEVSTIEGELVVLSDIELPYLPSRAEELINLTRKSGGITYAPHPYDETRHSLKDQLFELKNLDAIEVLNCTSNPKFNSMAMRAARILNKPGIANSDAHSPIEIGRAETILEVRELSIKEVFRAIKHNRILRRRCIQRA